MRPKEQNLIKKTFKGVDYTMYDDGALHILSSATDLTLDASEVRALFDLLVWTEGRWQQ